jgi:hypothetical protein
MFGTMRSQNAMAGKAWVYPTGYFRFRESHGGGAGGVMWGFNPALKLRIRSKIRSISLKFFIP